MKRHSPETCLHKVICDWLENLNDDLLTAVCLLDIKKCFDIINHKILNFKLEKYGICDLERSWFSSYLDERSQVVVCNGKISKSRDMTIGIPQGSTLGPVLFLLYVNDIGQYVHKGKCNLFADDTIIYSTGKSVKEVSSALQENLDDVGDWYQRNELMINVSKSNVMLIKGNKCVDDLLDVHIESKW